MLIKQGLKTVLLKDVKIAIRKDLTGQKFNMLTVLKELGGGKVLCKCDCGQEKELNKSNVQRGLVQSCGCIRKNPTKEWKMARVKNIVGQRFGKLVVLEELGNCRVLCQCDCGNVKNINKTHLVNGDIQSCGCLLAKSGVNNSKPFLSDKTNVSMLMSAVNTSKPQKNSKSGVRGVCWDKDKNKWRASIGFKGQKMELGRFDTLAEAIAVRKQAEEEYYKPAIDEWGKNRGQE